MDQILQRDGKEVRIFLTPEGVLGIVDTAIPMAAIDGLAAKLEKRIAERHIQALSADKNKHFRSPGK